MDDSMPSRLREDTLQIWNASVDSVRARNLVSKSVKRVGKQVTIGESIYHADDFDRVIVVGAGKAGTAMAQGLLDQIGQWRPTLGWVNVPQGTEQELKGIHTHPARPASINEPTGEGVRGSQRILDLVRNATHRDLCVVLISGGGSALMPAPIPEITLEDKQQLTRFLSAAGADIIELNTVRKHLSALKGGGLLRAYNGKKIITLILSDVLGDPLDQIASGPTVPDTTTAAQANEILRKYDPNQVLPERIYAALADKEVTPAINPEKTIPVSAPQDSAVEASSSGKLQDTPPLPLHETLVVGNNLTAVLSAERTANELGYTTHSESASSPEGTAEQVGTHLAQIAISKLRDGSANQDSPITNATSKIKDSKDQREKQKTGVITGGEPTVVLCPPDQRGIGGRNQQVVLAAYEYLLRAQLSPAEWSRMCLLSGGTDGEDGPTDAAGAILDQEVHHRVMSLQLDAADYLKRNDAYHFFQQVGGLILTGPTGTNVCDVRVMLIDENPVVV